MSRSWWTATMIRAAAVAAKGVSMTYPSGGYDPHGVQRDPLDVANSADRPSPTVDAVRLWTGGAATAVVAALVAIVGVLIAGAVFDVDVIGPTGEGSWGEVSITWLAVLAAAAALLATGILHLLLLSTPQPRRFFTWIVGLTTAAIISGRRNSGRETRHGGRGGSYRSAYRLAALRGGKESDPRPLR